MYEERIGYVYILSNWKHTVFYTGVTSNVMHRTWQHKTKYHPKSFSARYNVNKLLYVECYELIVDAIVREKQTKGYSRAKKIGLVKKTNPEFRDLSDDWNE